ncbi:MAG: hypothetical protein GX369_02465 [Euryarchaeota archaeon]|nr:hypothetical protein [Euryarchaeota archaeon]
MAKKRRKGKKVETYEWVPPEFDEVEFLMKDLRSTKSLIVTAGIAILFGILVFGIGTILGDLRAMGVIILFAVAASLKKIYPLLGIKESDVDNKALVGNIAIFIFLSLGVWIMLMNKPFFA